MTFFTSQHDVDESTPPKLYDKHYFSVTYHIIYYHTNNFESFLRSQLLLQTVKVTRDVYSRAICMWTTRGIRDNCINTRAIALDMRTWCILSCAQCSKRCAGAASGVRAVPLHELNCRASTPLGRRAHVRYRRLPSALPPT